MSNRSECVLYFSLDTNAVWWFNKFVIKNDYEFSFSFNLLNKQCNSFKHTVALKDWLESYAGEYAKLHVIIDYVSLHNYGEYSSESCLCDIILQYPEVQFLFDESPLIDAGIKGIDFRNYIFAKYPEIIKDVCIPDFHIFKIQDSGIFKSLILGKNNAFDASNLRYAIKKMKFKDLDVYDNWSAIRESRAHHLALVIEEERTQNINNSYSLYCNGFRVLPVFSATELKNTNSLLGNESPDNTCPAPDIILRDYDLQFPDMGPAGADTEIYIIRCWQHENKPNAPWIKQFPKVTVKKSGEDVLNPYWSNIEREHWDDKGTRIVYLTKGEPGMKLKDVLNEQGNGTDTVLLRGIKKPISGLLSQFHEISLIKEVFRDLGANCYKMETHRRGETGGHSIPLNIYADARNMIERAEDYFQRRQYVHAALLSADVLEYLNGFHQALMMRAYRCHARAENAVSMKILGCDERILAEDVGNHLDRIKWDIVRILSSSEEIQDDDENGLKPMSSSNGLKPMSSSMRKKISKKGRNIINQIFNDIREFCNKQEHFESEDVVISAIAHENERLF